ncbi:hypothetical protein K435DRAFT_773441 [Dendrothele bispora CBS 962.96]|uniref:Transcription termination and cleavage factor C-terminal domain-containing protein n=1 Tax=Dendrothele bispora (strain CBS 962.96) TaxID=1314807 RepID=A0A4S8MT95_DENBC|nr:hypothetical protein K435DRAFT_773441 [Dendrothele bispora CBS 962.96]
MSQSLQLAQDQLLELLLQLKKALAEYTASQANSSTPQPLASSSSRPTPPIAPASSIPPHMQAAQTQYRVGTPPSSSSSAMLTPPPSSLTPTNAYGGQGYGQGAGNWGPSSSSLPPSSSGVASGSSYGSYDAGVGSYSSSGYSGQTTTTTSTASQPQVNLLSSLNPAVLTSIPEEQKAMVVHVLSLTQEQINRLPPQDRTSILQLRATLGL